MGKIIYAEFRGPFRGKVIDTEGVEINRCESELIEETKFGDFIYPVFTFDYKKLARKVFKYKE